MTYMIIAFVTFVVTLFVWQRFFEEDTNPDSLQIILKITIAFLISLIWPLAIPGAGVFLIGYLVLWLASRN